MSYGNKKILVLPYRKIMRKALVGFLPRPSILYQKMVYGIVFFNFLKNAFFLIDEFIRRVIYILKK